MTAQQASDDEREILDAIERWTERELRPVARKFDHADEYPHEIVEQMKELGLFGATIATEYGGTPPLAVRVTLYGRLTVHGSNVPDVIAIGVYACTM